MTEISIKDIETLNNTDQDIVRQKKIIQELPEVKELDRLQHEKSILKNKIENYSTYNSIEIGKIIAKLMSVFEGIDYYSWYGSEDYVLTWNGIEELPDWLSIRLEDIENYESGWEVNASVTAEPLPADLAYREAIVRFTIPGDYIDYKFMQGKKDNDPINDYDVNFDGEITIADVNKLTNIILSGGNDTVLITVINSIIDKILTQEPYRPSNRLGR